MRIARLRLGALFPYRRALLTGFVLAAWPASCWAATEAPPPSRLRDPLSLVTRFLGSAPRETNQSRHRVASLPRREARVHVIRNVSLERGPPPPAYAYAYGYVSYYPYALSVWSGYPNRRYAYYYSPIPGYAGY